MADNIRPQEGFTAKSAAHFNRLSLRNGIALKGLARNPLDLEVFFQTALFFVSGAGKSRDLSAREFSERLEHFRSHHAAWLAATGKEIAGWLSACGLTVESDGAVHLCVPASDDFSDTASVEMLWSELQAERVRRRHRVRAALQAKNREVNAPKTVEVDPELDRVLMLEALRYAEIAKANGEVPVGAVIAVDGNVVAAAGNEVVTRHDPTAHAEIVAIRKAAALLGNERLTGATLYVTLEPCPMCAAACSMARIARVVWGADDADCGGMRGAVNVAQAAHLNHRPLAAPGVRRAECERILKDFFKEKRRAADAARKA